MTQGVKGTRWSPRQEVSVAVYASALPVTAQAMPGQARAAAQAARARASRGQEARGGVPRDPLLQCPGGAALLQDLHELIDLTADPAGLESFPGGGGDLDHLFAVDEDDLLEFGVPVERRDDLVHRDVLESEHPGDELHGHRAEQDEQDDPRQPPHGALHHFLQSLSVPLKVRGQALKDYQRTPTVHGSCWIPTLPTAPGRPPCRSQEPH